MNPILRKDLLAMFRSPLVGFLQVAFIATPTAFSVTTWPQGGMVPIASAARNDLLQALAIGQVAMLALFIPGIAGLSIVSERIAGTWEMLAGSRLSAWNIILGKLLGALALPFTLLACGLPFTALLYCRGDIELSNVFRIYGILITCGVLVTVVPMAISGMCADTITSLALSYVSVLGIVGGTLIPAAVMLHTQEGGMAMFLHGLRGVSPIAALNSLLQPQPGDFDGSQHGLPSSWQIYVPFAIGLIVVSVLLVSQILRRSFEQLSISPGNITAKSVKLSYKPFGSWNPVFGKERRTNLLSGTAWIARIFYTTLVLSLLLAVMSLYGGMEHPDVLRYVAQILIYLQMGIVALVAPALTSSSIVIESEANTLELLSLTPLASRHVFWGKLLPSLIPGSIMVAALIPAYVAICVVDPVYIHVFSYLGAVVLMTLAICCAIGLASSAIARTSVQAAMIAYAAVSLLVLAPAAGWWTSGVLLDPELSESFSSLSPLVAALSILPESTGGGLEIFRTHLMLMLSLGAILLLLIRWRLGIRLHHPGRSQ